LVVGAWPHLATPLAWPDSITAPDVASATVGILLVLAVIGTVRTVETPLVALVSVSVVGLLVSLAFARFASPDLALTQLLVELVTILLVLLALPHLPTMPRVQRSRTRALRDVLLASGAGVEERIARRPRAKHVAVSGDDAAAARDLGRAPGAEDRHASSHRLDQCVGERAGAMAVQRDDHIVEIVEQFGQVAICETSIGRRWTRNFDVGWER
jgi:uncharacterized MnhB-related membrane protein